MILKYNYKPNVQSIGIVTYNYHGFLLSKIVSGFIQQKSQDYFTFIDQEDAQYDDCEIFAVFDVNTKNYNAVKQIVEKNKNMQSSIFKTHKELLEYVSKDSQFDLKENIQQIRLPLDGNLLF